MPRVGDQFLDLTKLNEGQLKRLPNEQLRNTVENILELYREDRRQNQIVYYQPASQRARNVHLSQAKWVGVSGGNGSSKTETVLVHAVALATGVFPQDEELNAALKAQFRGPINVRIVVESFTTTLVPIILPKLKYSTWTGVDEQGGERGHWGWIPKTSLIDGSWDRSWSEKTKMLTVYCKDPETGKILGKSQFQFMSKDQEPDDFASGDFHLVIHDEPPLYAQWRENQARTMRVNGRIFLSFTWPDDPSVPVDWIYDEIYDKANGTTKHPNYDWFELWTDENVTLDQQAVAEQAAQWSEETRRVRLRGGSMRFSNRIHKNFTDITQHWCFTCQDVCSLIRNELNRDSCAKCLGENFVDFNHVQDFEIEPWPCVFLLDPHPRKPHMFCWAQVTPADDIRIINEDEIDESPERTAEHIFNMEEEMQIHVAARLIDPNMGRSPASAKRDITWQDEFDKSGLLCELADDSAVGRKTLDEYLKPDEHTLGPRFIVHSRCHNTIYQMKRYTWDDYKTSQERDVKQKPRPKYDDYPTLCKYLMNYNPQFHWLHHGAPVIKRDGQRRGAY